MRYIILVLLNTPIILMALINIIIQYKLKKASPARFKHQIFIWIIILVVLVGSFPLYNIIVGKQILDSSSLSVFDIVQTTAVIFLFYFLNTQRQKTDQLEQRLRDLHQELSIRSSLKE